MRAATLSVRTAPAGVPTWPLRTCSTTARAELRAAHGPGDPGHQGQGGQKQTRRVTPLVAHPAPEGISDHGDQDRRSSPENQERREDRASDVEGPLPEGGASSLSHPPARSSG